MQWSDIVLSYLTAVFVLSFVLLSFSFFYPPYSVFYTLSLHERSSDLSKKFKIAEGQWYRYAPSYVSPAYHLLEGFPFIQEPPSGDLQERVLIRHHDYDQCFQSVQLLQWNSQVKFNVTVYRNLPT